MQSNRHDSIKALCWSEAGLELLDQRRLPEHVEWLVLQHVGEVARAISDMVVRGAPAIGIAAAYGVVLAGRDRFRESPSAWRPGLEADLRLLADSRPTAVNLGWAITKMRASIEGVEGDPEPVLLQTAQRVHEEDIAANRRMGELGAALIEPGCGVLTHCNAGALATGGYGTALGVVRAAYAAGVVTHVYADETRPWLQGARLTAWELVQERIPVSLIADSAASYAMKEGKVGCVIVGADRVAANGDVANKIGTYSLALSARHHGVFFMVVAPTSTIDMSAADGAAIPIELRPQDEILSLGSRRIAATGAGAWNPVFDVTPAALVDVLVTERGVVHCPDADGISGLMA